jgi:transposase
MVRGTKRLNLLKKRRYRAAKLFEHGHHQAEVARHLDVSRQSVSRWYQQWLAGGKPSLRGAVIAGRHPRLNREQKDLVKRELLKGASAHGFSTELWTLPRVARLIERLTGIAYHPGHVWRLMGELGWSLQRPTTQARERKESQVRQWKEVVWEEVKKKQKGTVPG